MSRRKKDSAMDDFFKFLVEMPWWVGPICAILMFVLLRFLTPAILGGGDDAANVSVKAISRPLVMIATKLAPWGAGFVLFVWGMAELKKLTNRRRLDSQTGLDSIGDLSWQDFEELVAESFRRKGYEVELTGDAAGDGGVDVVLRRRGQKTLVQCKHWKTWTVDVKVVRELRGVMAADKADYGIIVSYGAFTADAEVFARDNRITLIGGDALVDMIRSIQREPRIPTDTTMPGPVADRPHSAGGPTPLESPRCPRCGTLMVKRTAKRGANAGSQFWGCPRYPACQGTRPA